MTITSNDYIIINGVSSKTLDIYVDTPSAPPMAKQRYTTYQTGTDEDGTSPDDTFEDMTYTITFYTFYAEDFNNNDIYAFFADAKTLQISRYSGYYFKVRQVFLNTPEVMHDGAKIRYRVEFKLAPFKYSIDNEPVSVSKGDNLTVGGTRYARPIYYVTPQGTGFMLSINNESFTVNGVTAGQECIIDCERMIVYTGSTLIYGSVGKFPFLAVGDNLISWEGNISLKIKKNERWY